MSRNEETTGDAARPAGPAPADILALCGSPRPRGNTQILVDRFAEGAREAGATVEVLRTADLRIEACKGCLRCNVLGRCAIRDDDWPRIGEAFAKAHGVLFASPMYFLHVTGTMKLALDRFRSLFQVRMVAGGDGLVHDVRYDPDKAYGLILVQGGAWDRGLREVRDLFDFIAGLGGGRREVDTLIGKRLGLSGQVGMGREALEAAFRKLGLPPDLAAASFEENQGLLREAREMGRRMAARILARKADPRGTADPHA